MLRRDVERLSGAFRDLDGDLRVRDTIEQISEPVRLDDIAGVDTRVVILVGEPNRQDTLFLERYQHCHSG